MIYQISQQDTLHYITYIIISGRACFLSLKNLSILDLILKHLMSWLITLYTDRGIWQEEVRSKGTSTYNTCSSNKPSERRHRLSLVPLDFFEEI